jgi:hypothetical protein
MKKGRTKKMNNFNILSKDAIKAIKAWVCLPKNVKDSRCPFFSEHTNKLCFDCKRFFGGTNKLRMRVSSYTRRHKRSRKSGMKRYKSYICKCPCGCAERDYVTSLALEFIEFVEKEGLVEKS